MPYSALNSYTNVANLETLSPGAFDSILPSDLEECSEHGLAFHTPFFLDLSMSRITVGAGLLGPRRGNPQPNSCILRNPQGVSVSSMNISGCLIPHSRAVSFIFSVVSDDSNDSTPRRLDAATYKMLGIPWFCEMLRFGHLTSFCSLS